MFVISIRLTEITTLNMISSHEKNVYFKYSFSKLFFLTRAVKKNRLFNISLSAMIYFICHQCILKINRTKKCQ